MKPHWLLGLGMLPVLYLKRRLERSPQFGGKGDYRRLRQSPNWRKGRFRNLDRITIREDLASLFGDLVGYWKAENTYPLQPLPVFTEDEQRAPPNDRDFITWYGHSAIRLESAGKTILLDPMLTDWVAPIPFLGHRFDYANPVDLDRFEQIDLIAYSHDHYDHLDYDTVLALHERTARFLVPLGVGAHLIKWGVDPAKIVELDWWDEYQLDEIRFVATPARHFGGRKMRYRNKSLWCGFAIYTAQQRIFFGGDSGYGRHFAEIGEKLGPFDLAMLDSGQYHKRWKHVHMQPEEALRAADEVKAESLLPIHWGGFTLSDHAWLDPVVRILAGDNRQCVVVPRIGERVPVDDKDYCTTEWWHQ